MDRKSNLSDTTGHCYGIRNEKFFSKTTKWFDPKRCMNQVSNVGSGEPLVYTCICEMLSVKARTSMKESAKFADAE